MKKWRPRATDTCCTCLKNRTQAAGSSHPRNYQHITAYRTARWQSDMLFMEVSVTLNEPISKRSSKSGRIPKIRLTLSRTPRPKIRIKTTTLRNRKSGSRMPKQRTRPSSPSTAQLITSCSTNLPRRGIPHRPASSILQSPPARPHGAGGPFCAAKSRPSGKNDRKYKKPPEPQGFKWFFLNGAAIQIRTGDLILTKDALYQLSYSSKWRPGSGSNRRPPA